MSERILFSAWFQKQEVRTDAVGAASRVWFGRPGKARRGRVNAARLEREAGIHPETAKQVISEFAAL